MRSVIVLLVLLSCQAYAGKNPFYSPLDKYAQLEKQAEEAKKKSEEKKEEAKDKVLTLEIIGVIKVGNVKLLEAKKNGQIKFFKVGDYVDGWKVKEIDLNRVVFARGKEEQVIPIN